MFPFANTINSRAKAVPAPNRNCFSVSSPASPRRAVCHPTSLCRRLGDGWRQKYRRCGFRLQVIFRFCLKFLCAAQAAEIVGVALMLEVRLRPGAVHLHPANRIFFESRRCQRHSDPKILNPKASRGAEGGKENIAAFREPFCREPIFVDSPPEDSDSGRPCTLPGKCQGLGVS